MYKKIHIKLTSLFTIVTGLILIIMSVCCLYTSEKELKSNYMLSFSNDMNTIITNLEQQTTITQEWLSKTSSNGKYLIAIYDQGIPFSYTKTSLSSNQLHIASKIKSIFKENGISSDSNASDYTSIHHEFSYKIKNDSYYACVGEISPSTKNLDIVILRSTKVFEHRLFLQRIYFILIDIIGILILFIFSLIYTKRLLAPIRKSYEKQTAFIASASHELRTPLAVISSSASAIKLADTAKKQHFLSIIQSETKHMSVLVDDMLTLARADNDTWSFNIEKTELDTLLLKTYESFEHIAHQKNLNFRITLPKDSIPCCLCDPERISQVLAILTSNAISYTPEGGEIHFKLEYIKSAFCIFISDNGIGIPKAEKNLIFDRFYRADSSHSEKEHFGLGLCIAKEIIDKHKGIISVTDTAGGGATFTIVLR